MSWDYERTRQRMDLFLETGFNTFIDLTSEGELLPYAPILTEQSGLYNLSAAYQRFSIGDFGVPSVDQMKKILDTLTHRFRIHGRSIFIAGEAWAHRDDCRLLPCTSWKNRGGSPRPTGGMVATFPKHNLHPRSPETDEQVKFILGWKAGQ